MFTETRVVTYVSQFGTALDVCTDCEKTLAPWPKDDRGSEYATVSQGAHVGGCQVCRAGLPAWEWSISPSK